MDHIRLHIRLQVHGKWIQSFKNTPKIHLIIPLSAVNNSWTASVTTDQVSLPHKSTFLTHMLITFTLSFVQIARLVRIGNNSRNAFHQQIIYVETASEQQPHWPNVSTRYLKVDSTWKRSFLMLTSLKWCNSSRYNLTRTFTANKIFAVNKVISYSWTLYINPQITRCA